MSKQFNPAKREKLNNPARLEMIDPRYIWDRMKLDRHETKVEIGAGTGLFSRAFQQLSNRGITIALDISEEMVMDMRENVSVDTPEILPRLVTGKRLPVEDDSADLVYMITVHHELDDPEAMMGEVYRILRKGGRLFIVDWNSNNPDKGPSAQIRYRPERVASQLEEQDFINVTIDPGFEDFFFVTAEK